MLFINKKRKGGNHDHDNFCVGNFKSMQAYYYDKTIATVCYDQCKVGLVGTIYNTAQL